MTESQGIEFRDGELEQLAMDEKYVVKYKTVYIARYSENTGAGLEKVYYSRAKLPLTKRGRWHAMDYSSVNRLLGFELLIR